MSTTTEPGLPGTTANSAGPAAASRVFISYASHDSEVAQRLCAALEAAGVACWIAPRDVHPGEPYAAAIVHAINDCRALVLLVSEHSVGSPHVHREVERAGSKGRTVFSVRLDTVELPPELEYFLSANQWLDTGGRGIDTVVPALVHTLQLPPGTQGAPAHAAHGPPGPGRPVAPAVPAAAGGLKRLAMPVALAVVALALVGLVVDRFAHRERAATVAVLAVPQAPARAGEPFEPPAHSVAVLPFENLSGATDQEYFSDGLSEELLNSLATIRDLQVAARTSSFSFKGSKASTQTIAQQLNVGALLEGSVRRERNHVRISAQLVNAMSGFQMWSGTYDREIKDVLTLQTEIATAVTRALQATLMNDASTAIELGGTQNPAALDAFLRARALERGSFDAPNTLSQYKAYTEALTLDPGYAKAYVGASAQAVQYANNFVRDSELDTWRQRAQSLAEKAVALAPNLGVAHTAMATVWERMHLDFSRARSEYDRAIALSPNDVETLLRSGWFLVNMGYTAEGMPRFRKAIELDQLNPRVYIRMAYALNAAHQYAESIQAMQRYLQITPGDPAAADMIGANRLALGDAAAALAQCSHPNRTWLGRFCRTLALDRLHRGAEADAEYQTMRDELGNSAAYQYTVIEVARGHIAQALDWLDVAAKVRDPGLVNLRTDQWVDPLRQEPRFQAIYKALNFPSQ